MVPHWLKSNAAARLFSLRRCVQNTNQLVVYQYSEPIATEASPIFHDSVPMRITGTVIDTSR